MATLRDDAMLTTDAVARSATATSASFDGSTPVDTRIGLASRAGADSTNGAASAAIPMMPIPNASPPAIAATRHCRNRISCRVCAVCLIMILLPSTGFDFDQSRRGLRARFTGHGDRQDPMLELGLQSIRIGIARQRQDALEGSIAALHPVDTGILLFPFLPLFAADQQRVVQELQLKIARF